MPENALSDSVRRLLPAYARAVLESAVQGRGAPEPEVFLDQMGLASSPELRQKRGVFVTLTRGKALRGCIGTIAGVAPLMEAVRDNALSAAFKDPRFLPVTDDELPDLDLEVSVLTPPQPVAGWRDIEIPRHGVVLSKGDRRSVFLPQVAAEMGWDLPTTLSQLALKAGLDADAWREGARFATFETEILPEVARKSRSENPKSE